MPGAPVFVTEVSADRYGEQAPQLAVPDDGSAALPCFLVSSATALLARDAHSPISIKTERPSLDSLHVWQSAVHLRAAKPDLSTTPRYYDILCRVDQAEQQG